MNLPPLPLIDGCLFVDNSGFMEGASTCYRYLEYKSLRLRIPSAEKTALNFGSAIHLALEHRYRKYQNRQVDQQYYEELTQILTKFYTEHPSAAEDWRTMNFAMEMVKRYNQRYDVEEFNLLADKDNVPLVELPFALHLMTYRGRMTFEGEPPEWFKALITNFVGNNDRGREFEYQVKVIYSGRIDLPVSISGQTFVMDHKTTSMMGSQFFDEMRMTAQQRGYCWAFGKLTGKPVTGYVINGIRTKDIPAYAAAGKTAVRQGKTHSAESWWQETFQRERYLLKPGELDDWHHNVIDLIEEFFWHYERDYMPQKTKWCCVYGRCPYYDVCSLVKDDRLTFLQSGLFTNNTWSPLHQPTQSKQ